MARRILLSAALLVSILGTALSASAADYVIDGNGLFFGGSQTEAWSAPGPNGMSCSETPREFQDPAGGRGIVLKDCATPRSPYSYVTLRTKMYDPEKWSTCSVVARENGSLKLLCPRIYANRK